MAAKTMFEKIWESHVVRTEPDGTALIYIDRHLVHEVTSPQAFEGLQLTGRTLRRPQAALAVPDHNVQRRIGTNQSKIKSVPNRSKPWKKIVVPRICPCLI